MQTLKYVIGADRRALVKDVQDFKIDFSGVKNWLQARQYEDGMRQVFVNVANEDGTPFDLTGCNVMFEGLLPDGTHRIMDAKHSVIIDPANGQFRFDFPKQAFSVAGSYKQAFFRIMRDGSSVTTLEFSLEVLADKVISGIVPSDYLTPFEDLYAKLSDILANADGEVKAKLLEWQTQINGLITNLNGDYASIQLLVTGLRSQLDDIAQKIKDGKLFTQADMDSLIGKTDDFKMSGTTIADKLNNEFTDREINVKWYGAVGDGITDDTSAINRAIDAANGQAVYLPSGDYKISSNIVVSKKVHLKGNKPTYSDGNLMNGTVIRGGGGIFLIDGSSGSVIDGIGVIISDGFTNGFDVRGVLSGITIQNCLTIAKSHGFLIESYDGVVDGTVVKDCEAYDSVHGFISKATRTTFDSCLVKNVGFWGFGIISDNIEGADKIGAAINNKVVNCRAVNAGVGFAQYRRNYFADNPGVVPCNNNQFLGCSNIDCTYGLSVGDKVGDTGDGKYTTYPVTNTIVTNYSESGGKVRLSNSKNLVINGISLQTVGEASEDSTHTNIGMTLSGVSGQKLGNYGDLQILDTTETPSIGFGREFRTNNVDYTTITDLKNAVSGENYTIILWENYTTIDNSETIHLREGAVQGNGNSVTLKCQGINFFEIKRTNSIDRGTQTTPSTDGIEPGMHRFVDIAQLPDTTYSKIKIKNPEAHDADLTILIRPTTGTIIPASFDSEQFVIPSDLPTSLTFDNGLMTHWKYLIAIKKYVLVSWRLTKYYQPSETDKQLAAVAYQQMMTTQDVTTLQTQNAQMAYQLMMIQQGGEA